MRCQFILVCNPHCLSNTIPLHHHLTYLLWVCWPHCQIAKPRIRGLLVIVKIPDLIRIMKLWTAVRAGGMHTCMDMLYSDGCESIINLVEISNNKDLCCNGHTCCHRAACKRVRELLGSEDECIWPLSLVEQSRLGVGKILLRLMTHPSSMYPR